MFQMPNFIILKHSTKNQLSGLCITKETKGQFAYTVHTQIKHTKHAHNRLPWVEDLLRRERGRENLAKGQEEEEEDVGERGRKSAF